MEDSKIILSSSSPSLSPSGNNENESENQHNSQRKNKHFMAPTFSTASKFTTPKKKILAEWKPTNLDSKSSLHKMCSSNATPCKSLSKNPSFSLSPKNYLVQFDETNANNNYDNEDETFVADSCAVPYDPLTNYLSPRPKFLRFNPNRKRKFFLSKENNSGNCKISPEKSLDSESSCTPESSLKNEESVGHVQNLEGEKMEEDKRGSCSPESSFKNEESEGNKQHLEGQDIEEEEEEELIEEIKWGLKWVLCKSLIVFLVLVFSTMYISSMNSPAFYPDSRRPTFESENFGNISCAPFSLRNLELKLVFDGREELERGLSEINQLGVDGMIGGLVEAPGIEVREESKGSFDCELEETEVAISPQVPLSEEEHFITKFHDEIDYQETVRASYDFNSERECYYGVFSEKIAESFKDVEAEDEAQMTIDPTLVTEEESYYGVFSEKIAESFKDVEAEDEAQMTIDPTLVTEEESWVYFEDKMNHFESKPEDGNLSQSHEVEIVSEDTCDDIDQENKGEDKVVDFDLKSKDGDSVNVVEIAAEGQINGSLQENQGGYESKMANCKSKNVQSGNEAEDGADSQIDGSSEGSIDENDDFQLRLTLKDFVWLVALTVMGFVACLVVKFYHKCKKLFSKTTSKKKSNSEVKMVEINRLAGLPQKVGERFEQLHLKVDSQVNLPPSTAVIKSREERVHTPSRIVPKVKQLGELDFGREFSSLQSSAVRSGKVQESEASVFVVPDERRTKRSKVSSSSSESHSYLSNISEEKTTKQEEGKDETTSLRRSRRLWSRGLTSP